MIREATDFDIPAIVGMVEDLHAATRMALEINPLVVAQTLRALIADPKGLLLVAGDDPHGFIAASVGVTAVSMAPIALEHGWWSSGGARGTGARLLLRYERWAEQAGCQFVRMCTPPFNKRAALLLERRGFFLSEQVWVKAL